MERLADSDLATLAAGHCPICKERGFVLGPRGGVAQNIECANLGCRARFNVVTYAGNVLMAEVIESEKDGGATWPSAPHRGTFS